MIYPLPPIAANGAFIALCLALVALAHLPALVLPPVEENEPVAFRRDINAHFSAVALAFATAQMLPSGANLLGRLLLVLSVPLLVGLAGQRKSAVVHTWVFWFLIFHHFAGQPLYLRNGFNFIEALLYWSVVSVALVWVNAVTCLPARYILFRRLERQQGRTGAFAAWVSEGVWNAATAPGVPPLCAPLVYRVLDWFASAVRGCQSVCARKEAASPLTNAPKTDAYMVSPVVNDAINPGRSRLGSRDAPAFATGGAVVTGYANGATLDRCDTTPAR